MKTELESIRKQKADFEVKVSEAEGQLRSVQDKGQKVTGSLQAQLHELKDCKVNM
jgi:chromosome condensin MukBEF complex kleisin-like MukF subunit